MLNKRLVVLTIWAWLQVVETNKRHPCQRECTSDGLSKECYYTFVIERYLTMADYCFDCPFNQSACFNKGCVPADGWERDVTVINRGLPGPGIQVCVGDTVEVTVVNRLNCDVTIHWHGEHQISTPYMDGTPMVTQCPIVPWTNFTYSFTAETVGTHFYHSHSAFQKDDGVVGALIHREPKDEDPNGNTYDKDLFSHIMLVQDWTHTTTEAHFMEVQRPEPVLPPLGMLVNGLGANRTFYNDADDTNYYTPVAQFNVTKGYKYRFRVIGSGIFACPIRVSVDKHTMLIIALDGAPVEPFPVDAFDVLSGERVDFVLNANRSVGRYWIKFQGQIDCADNSERTFQHAILHYRGADSNSAPPGNRSYDTAGRRGRLLNPANVAPGRAHHITIPKVNASRAIPDDDSLKSKADHQFYLVTDHKVHRLSDYTYDTFPLMTLRTPDVPGLLTLPFNNITYIPPSYPLLTEGDLRGFYNSSDFCNENTIDKQYCARHFCPCTHLIQIPVNRTVELVIIDLGVPLNSTHPVHLHGYAFRVVAMHRFGTSTTVKQVRRALSDGTIKRKLSRAPLKDTVAVPDGGVTVVRFVTNNPGFWFFHCHLGMHLDIGMALVFQVGNYSDMNLPYHNTDPKHPYNYNVCGNKRFQPATFYP